MYDIFRMEFETKIDGNDFIFHNLSLSFPFIIKTIYRMYFFSVSVICVATWKEIVKNLLWFCFFSHLCGFVFFSNSNPLVSHSHAWFQCRNSYRYWIRNNFILFHLFIFVFFTIDIDFDSYWDEEARNPNRNRIRIGRQYQAQCPLLLKSGIYLSV